MRCYRIGDFAREMGVSADFIKYYEKSNLLTPQVDAANKYRSLGFDQCRWILEIRKYRNLGFRVNEIDAIFNESDSNDIIGALGKKRDEYERRMQWYELLADYFDSMRETARCKDGDEWYVRRCPAVYFLPHTEGTAFITTKATRAIFKEWTPYIPIVQSACMVAFDPTELQKGKAVFSGYQYGLSVLESYANRLGLSHDAPVLRIPERRCLEYYHDGPFIKQDSGIDSASLTVLEAARKNHFKIAENMLSACLMLYKKGQERRKLDVFYAPLA